MQGRKKRKKLSRNSLSLPFRLATPSRVRILPVVVVYRPNRNESHVSTFSDTVRRQRVTYSVVEAAARATAVTRWTSITPCVRITRKNAQSRDDDDDDDDANGIMSPTTTARMRCCLHEHPTAFIVISRHGTRRAPSQ